MSKRNGRKGFTIIELVIVIAVIGILTAILIPTFMGITDKAHQTENETFVRNINTQLAIEEATEGKSPTMYDAIKAGRTIGFDVEKITPYNSNDIIWDSVNDRFAIVKGNYAQAVDAAEKKARIVYSDASFDVNTPLYKLWKVYPDAAPGTQNYSIYAKAGWSTDVPVSVTVGFDAGDNVIESVTYTGTTETREIIVRTNGSAAALEVTGYVDPLDATKGDSIKHYGTAGKLNVIKCALGSYSEYGTVGFAEITTGRIVLEKGSDVDQIHINKKAGENTFDEVYIKDNGASQLPRTITRDRFAVSETTKVVTVESAGKQEIVYAYADGSTGTTEKTVTQNPDVDTPLGKLVLDNGGTSKALSDEEKTAAKQAGTDFIVDFEMIEENDDYVARIGKEGFLTFEDAINAYKASEADSSTIIILKDCSFTSQVETSSAKSLVLDLNGHTIDQNGHRFQAQGNLRIVNASSSEAVLDNSAGDLALLAYNQNESSLIEVYDTTIRAGQVGLIAMSPFNQIVVNNSKIYGMRHGVMSQRPNNTISISNSILNGRDSCGVYLGEPNDDTTLINCDISGGEYGILLYDSFDLSIYGGKVQGDVGIVTNGSYCLGANILLDGVEVVGESYGAYIAGAASTTLKDVSFYGKSKCGIEIRAGDVTVSGNSTFRTDCELLEVKSNLNGTTTKGAGLSIVQHGTNTTMNVVINNGSTFVGQCGLVFANPEANTDNNVSYTVNGGQFNGAQVGILNLDSRSQIAINESVVSANQPEEITIDYKEVSTQFSLVEDTYNYEA